MEDKIKQLEKKVQELMLFTQSLEQRVADLENGEFGTGIYLEGCNDADKDYIKPLMESKKEGE